MTAIGLGIAYGTSRLASSWFYDVRPSDPWILGSALAVVVGVTVVATLIPVGRAARIDPALSLVWNHAPGPLELWPGNPVTQPAAHPGPWAHLPNPFSNLFMRGQEKHQRNEPKQLHRRRRNLERLAEKLKDASVNDFDVHPIHNQRSLAQGDQRTPTAGGLSPRP